MRVLLVRHGKMDFGDGELTLDPELIRQWFNAERQAGLAPQGRREAATVARTLLKNPVDAIYSSGLDRARETAEDSAERLGLRVQITDDLAELRPGRLRDERLVYGALRLLYELPLSDDLRKKAVGATLISTTFAAWLAGRTTGGETRGAFEARLTDVFDRLRRDHGPDARVALFAHGYVILYTSVWLTAPGPVRRGILWRTHVPNGAITELELPPSGPPQLLRYADATHL